MILRYSLSGLAAALWVTLGLFLVACSTPSGDTSSERRDEAQPVTLATPTLNEAEQSLATKQRRVRQPAAAVEEIVVTAAADQALLFAGRAPAPPFYQDYGRENYERFENNGVHWVTRDPVSTFSIDVDSAAYANMRRQLNEGQLPAPDSIRVEELINYFSYDYPRPDDRATPFSIYTEMGPSPWASNRKLLHVGINGWQPAERALPPANLVFLIDVSGSMQAPNKLYLLKSAMKLLVSQLRAEDRIAIAVYAGAAGEVLAPTAGNEKARINAAIDNLQAGGSTNGGAGIRLAYNLATQGFVKDGINRVILATDGDFNVGTTDVSELENLVERKRESGVALTVLGFGTGNYNDQLMQTIAQAGNGNAAYIDTLNEARKVLVEELGSTLDIIAKDMKVQIEFNPAVVETYRLIGYETRHLEREDFNNDKVDAGDVGAGHTVTALYEITLAGSQAIADPLRYGGDVAQPAQRRAGNAEVAFLKLRYKRPDESTSRLIERPLYLRDMGDELAGMSASYRFSGAVAWLGQLLRGNQRVENDDLKAVAALARAARGDDPHGYRSEFLNLVQTASALRLAEVSLVQPPAPDEHG